MDGVYSNPGKFKTGRDGSFLKWPVFTTRQMRADTLSSWAVAVLKLEGASEPPGGPVKTEAAGPTPRAPSSLWWGPSINIVHKLLPGATR